MVINGESSRLSREWSGIGIKQGHRSVFAVVGDKAQDQVCILIFI